jgi:hypothetical protein
MPTIAKKKPASKKAVKKTPKDKPKPAPTKKVSDLVTNELELAKRLGFTNRKTVSRMKRHDAAPKARADGSYEVSKWIEFRDNVWNVEKTRPDIGGNSPLTEIKIDREKLRLLHDQLDYDEALGKLESQEEVQKVIGDMASGLFTAIRQLEHELYRDFSGMTDVEAKDALRSAIRKTMEKFSLGEWAKKKAFWSPIYAQLRDLQATLKSGSGSTPTN